MRENTVMIFDFGPLCRFHSERSPSVNVEVVVDIPYT